MTSSTPAPGTPSSGAAPEATRGRHGTGDDDGRRTPSSDAAAPGGEASDLTAAADEAERALAEMAKAAERAVAAAHDDGHSAVSKGYEEARRAAERAYEQSSVRAGRP